MSRECRTEGGSHFQGRPGGLRVPEETHPPDSQPRKVKSPVKDLTEALPVIGGAWEQPTCKSVGKWVSKLWSVHSTAITRGEANMEICPQRIVK